MAKAMKAAVASVGGEVLRADARRQRAMGDLREVAADGEQQGRLLATWLDELHLLAGLMREVPDGTVVRRKDLGPLPVRPIESSRELPVRPIESSRERLPWE
jgi:hypothetical protein